MPGDFTILLRNWSHGDRAALDTLTPIVYQELRRLAAGKMGRERAGHTLQATALVHEAYLKLVDRQDAPGGSPWQSRGQFFALASGVMRHILVDNARKHRSAKRGSGTDLPLDEALSLAPEKAGLVIALDDALQELAKVDERRARLIELKYFTGLQGAELAEALGVSLPTVTRDSRLAEAWLRTYLAGE